MKQHTSVCSHNERMYRMGILKLLCVLCLLASCCAYRSRSRSRSSRYNYGSHAGSSSTPNSRCPVPRIPNRPLNNNCNGGIRLPPRQCFTKFQTFENCIVGKTWLSLYSASENDFRQTKGRWSVEPDGSIKRVSSRYAGATMSCTDRTDRFVRQDPNSCWAVFATPPDVVPSGIITADRTDTIITTDPDKYFVHFICRTRSTTQPECCSNAALLIVVNDQRVDTDGDGVGEGLIELNGIPWCDIEKILNNCLGMSFVRNTPPIMRYQWRDTGGVVCPFAF